MGVVDQSFFVFLFRSGESRAAALTQKGAVWTERRNSNPNAAPNVRCAIGDEVLTGRSGSRFEPCPCASTCNALYIYACVVAECVGIHV